MNIIWISIWKKKRSNYLAISINFSSAFVWLILGGHFFMFLLYVLNSPRAEF